MTDKINASEFAEMNMREFIRSAIADGFRNLADRIEREANSSSPIDSVVTNVMHEIEWGIANIGASRLSYKLADYYKHREIESNSDA